MKNGFVLPFETLRQRIGNALLKFGIEEARDHATMQQDPSVSYPVIDTLLNTAGKVAFSVGKLLVPEANRVDNATVQQVETGGIK